MTRLGDADWISRVNVTEAPVDHLLSRIAWHHATLRMDVTLGIPIKSTHKSLVPVHVVEEHQSKIFELLNQMYNEMDGYFKEIWQEVGLKETHHLNHLLLKIF
jgi:hypothetical protein